MSLRRNTIAPTLHHLMAGASSDPVVPETRMLVDNRVRVNAGLSTTNSKAGLVLKDWRTIPADVVLAFMDQLSVAEIFKAAQVCTNWRTVALSHTSLWTCFEVRVTLASRSDTIGSIDSLVYASSDSDESEEDDSDDEDYITLSNLYLLQQLLPRAQTQPLTVTISVPEPSTTSFVGDLRCFLKLVAPQLVALNVHSFCPELVQRVLGRKDWAFPMLRRLVCSNPNPGAAPSPGFDFRRITCPALAHLDLGAHAQVAHLSPQPTLTYLRAHVRRLEHVLPLLLAAQTVTRLDFAIRISELGPASGSAATRAAVFAALNTLQEVCICTQNDAHCVDGVLTLVQRLQCPRVVLELSDGFAGRRFRPVLGGPWVNATELLLHRAPDALEIVLTDATQRTLTIRLLCDAGRMQPLEWHRVLSLPALTTLRVDASVWSLAMRNFPHVPQLAETTLVVDAAARGLDAVMEYSLGARKRRMWSQKLVIEIGSTQVAIDVALEDELSWEVPQVPRGSRLTLSSNKPVSIAKWGLDDIMWRLGAKQVLLDGVSMGAHRSM